MNTPRNRKTEGKLDQMPKTKKALARLFGKRTTNQSPAARRAKPKAKPPAKAKKSARTPPPSAQKAPKKAALKPVELQKLSEAIGALDAKFVSLRSNLQRLEEDVRDLEKESDSTIKRVEVLIDTSMADEKSFQALKTDIEAFSKVFHTHIVKLNEPVLKPEAPPLYDDLEHTPAPAVVNARPGDRKYVRIGGELYEANGLLCSDCGLDQAEVPGSGVSCPNGHGGALGMPPPSDEELGEETSTYIRGENGKIVEVARNGEPLDTKNPELEVAS